jgi:UDP-N-acetylglucosamine diphosphorylase/glucosamine-1-phosphate N-acetyltransferase
MNIIFTEPFRNTLLPFTYTKPVSQLRCGILTLAEKWQYFFKDAFFSNLTEDYLSEKYPIHLTDDNLFINASVIPTKELVSAIKSLDKNSSLVQDKSVLAKRADHHHDEVKSKEYQDVIIQIKNTWDIFRHNHKAIRLDFELLTAERNSQPVPDHVDVFGSHSIFIEEGAKLYNCTLNATDGPIYIGKDAEIMELSTIRGPFALCNNGVIKMSAKIYSGTTVGPFSKVGGEVNNSVIQGYSNKGHDGFLGNSVLGEWCNLGADTNTSNLKNNYAPVKLWDYNKGIFSNTGLQFCGLMMGDHSKCGINTMFNTGTVVGVSANIFGEGFPRNFIPSFSWGGKNGFMTYKLEKVFEVAEVVMQRRGKTFNDLEKSILNHIFEQTMPFRKRY